MAFTVANYILTRLKEQQVDTLFGVPAAYCSPLFDAAIGQGMKSVVAASDLEAGYAADGYARTKGLGAVSVAGLANVNGGAGVHAGAPLTTGLLKAKLLTSGRLRDD